ncbi:alpha/beta hydrolase [Gaetbulibacter aestuarii]|uniref:Alpha/beta hydrolase-fold protein n=1 Tax=Gaetbulibacter aestuarii TaxID=1502358 RepID=A0ABW7MVA2_9FLAO
MKKIIYLFTILFIIACKDKNPELDKLKTENDSLKVQINALKNRPDKSTYVTLANTATEEITSSFNGQTYQLKISYPKGYFKEKEQHYPVLYVIDAETNFGGVSYIVQRLIKDKLIPKILVVGIAYNTDYDSFYQLRSRDLTPVNDPDLKISHNKTIDPTGGAPLFCKFMENELFPFIEKKLRVKENDRAIYGHSYGGLFGTYVLLSKPQLFHRYLLLSPSLWFKDNMMINQVKNKNLEYTSKKILYMASGKLEPRIDDLQIDFIHLLKNKNVTNLDIKSEVKQNETHRTIFGVGFTNGLRYIYHK